MKTGVVILSRYSSNRLPGKALMLINGKKVLKYILERVSKVFTQKQIIIATSRHKSDDIIEEFANNESIKCYRGSLENVSRRFYLAATNQGWEYAARINGDNIFVDIPLLKKMTLKAESGKYKFISNVKKRTFPKGMSIEIINIPYYGSLLKKIDESEEYMEHVTLYLYNNEENSFLFEYNSSIKEAKGIQLALDTKEDVVRTEQLLKNFTAPHYEYNLEEIIEIWKKLKNEKSI